MAADSEPSMDSIQEKTAPARRVFRVPAIFIRPWTAIVLLGMAFVAYSVYLHVFADATLPTDAQELRLPVANPALEPERPDLIGEPRIDE
jgi:hypothetical protein